MFLGEPISHSFMADIYITRWRCKWTQSWRWSHKNHHYSHNRESIKYQVCYQYQILNLIYI